jgi:hypothetical protein
MTTPVAIFVIIGAACIAYGAGWRPWPRRHTPQATKGDVDDLRWDLADVHQDLADMRRVLTRMTERAHARPDRRGRPNNGGQL